LRQLDPASLRQLLLSFEKKITKNQKMRMKHPDEPDKFMESEVTATPPTPCFPPPTSWF